MGCTDSLSSGRHAMGNLWHSLGHRFEFLEYLPYKCHLGFKACPSEVYPADQRYHATSHCLHCTRNSDIQHNKSNRNEYWSPNFTIFVGLLDSNFLVPPKD